MPIPIDTRLQVPYKPALGSAPSGEPRALSVSMDFSAGTTITYSVDLTVQQQAGTIGGIQTLFLDNSANSAQLIVTSLVTGQVFRIASATQGFFPVLSTKPSQFTFEMSGGTGNVICVMMDFSVPYQVWNLGGAGNFIFNGSGYGLVSDPLLDACIVGGRVKVTAGVDAAVSGGRVLTTPIPASGTPTDASVSTVGAVDTQLLAANAAREYLLIAAPQSAGVWINFAGGAAGPNLTGCIWLPAGSIYESGAYVTRAAIHYYCSTAGVELACLEG